MIVDVNYYFNQSKSSLHIKISLGIVDSCNVKVNYKWSLPPVNGPGASPVTPAECCQLCTESSICGAWNWFSSNGGTCVFYACGNGNLIFNDGAISGLPNQERD